MLDIYFRSLKDRVFNPICGLVPTRFTPFHVTSLAFTCGMRACFHITTEQISLSLFFWLLNRALDCLDGALARHRGQASDLGGFLDLLGDFVVYSLIPIACAVSDAAQEGQVFHLWSAVAFVEASFHVNNFVLFYAAAVLEKRKAEVAAAAAKRAREGETDVSDGSRDGGTRELTSVMMRPALIEGMESGIIFTLMLARPDRTETLCWIMAILVSIGIGQRVWWLVPVLS